MTTDPKQPEAQEAPASERQIGEMPAYGAVPWTTLRALVAEATMGKRDESYVEVDPTYSIGHQPVTMNWNSLNRIVSAALGKQPTQEAALESMFSVDVINCVRVWGLPDDYLEAFMAGKARPSTPLRPTQEADAWKKAVDDELALCESTVSSFPDARAAVRGLIDWHVRNAK